MLVLSPYRLLGRFGRLMSVGWKRGHGPSKRKGSTTRQSSSNVQSPQMLRFLLRAVNAGTPQWKLVFPVSRRHSRQSQGKHSLPPGFGMASLVRVFPAMSNSPTSAALLAKSCCRSPNTPPKARSVRKRVTFSPDCK